MIVRSTRAALADLEHARAYIAQENPRAAEATAARIRAAVDGLRDLPNMGREGRVPGTRELVVARPPPSS